LNITANYRKTKDQ